MSSDDIRHDLPALLRGELDAGREEEIRLALDADPELRRELRELAEIDAILGEHVESAQVTAPTDRVEGSTEPSAAVGPGRRRRVRLVFASGAALVAAAAVVALIVLVPLRDSPPPRDVITLEPTGEMDAAGEAVLVDDADRTHLEVDVRSLEAAPSDHFYEAWMLSSDDNEPVSLGVVDEEGGTWLLPEDLPADYDIVDISLEPVTGGPQHSGLSILRGGPVQT